MKKAIAVLSVIAALAASSVASGDDLIYDTCPNIEGQQYGIPAGYELKWSNRYDAYICVVQHQFSPKQR